MLFRKGPIVWRKNLPCGKRSSYTRDVPGSGTKDDIPKTNGQSCVEREKLRTPSHRFRERNGVYSIWYENPRFNCLDIGQPRTPYKTVILLDWGHCLRGDSTGCLRYRHKRVLCGGVVGSVADSNLWELYEKWKILTGVLNIHGVLLFDEVVGMSSEFRIVEKLYLEWKTIEKPFHYLKFTVENLSSWATKNPLCERIIAQPS